MIEQPVTGRGSAVTGAGGQSGSVFNTVTEKVSEGLLAVAQRVEGGVAQIEANPPAALSSVAPTIGRYGHSAARALERSADYVRDLDLEQLKQDATAKVKRNPGTSLLIAAGIGFILGGMLKKKGL